MIRKFKTSMTVKMILFRTKVLPARDIIYTSNNQKNQMNLPMEMPLMIKKSRMSMMVKMISFKMKDLLVRDIIFMPKLIVDVTRKDIITSVRDTQMNLLTAMQLMIRKFKMSTIQKTQLSKMKDSLERDIIFMLKNRPMVIKNITITLARDILMRLLTVMLLTIKKFRMNMILKIQLSKMKVLLERDIIFMHKNIKLNID